tara:strand:+ start:1018 stop:1365 length:348 start_codon:yes stop_codon:yes gene_type:complete
MSVTKETKSKQKKCIWLKEEKETSKEVYGCEILIENGSLDDVMTTDAPTDAFIVTYEIDGMVHRDLTRGSRVHLFDMYYDKFKMGLKVIDYGKGGIKPNLWGYRSPTSPKKKRKS